MRSASERQIRQRDASMNAVSTSAPPHVLPSTRRAREPEHFEKQCAAPERKCQRQPRMRDERRDM